MKSVIQELYEKHIPLKIYKTLRSYTDWELMYDFEQEMITQLIGRPQELIQHLYDNKELDNYFAQICINQLVNPKSVFNKLYETQINKDELTNYENVLYE